MSAQEVADAYMLSSFPEWRDALLQGIEDDKHIELYGRVILELKFANAKGSTYNAVEREYNRLMFRRTERLALRAELLALAKKRLETPTLAKGAS